MVFRNLERKIVRIFQKAREISEGGRGIPELEDRPQYVGSVYVPYQSMSIVSTMMVRNSGYLPDAGWAHEQPRQAAHRRRPVEVREQFNDPLIGPVKIESPMPVDVFQVERLKKGDDDPGPSSLG